MSKIKQVLSSSAYFGISSNKSAQIETFWNLANLAYADTVFSESENLILKELQNEWKIPDDILLEFKDTAETILLLKKIEEWLKSIGGTPTYVEEQIAIVEKDIKRLMDYVKTTIKSAKF